MKFVRKDGIEIDVVKGFRDQALTYRASQTPKGEWSEDDYLKAVDKRVRRTDKIVRQLARFKADIKSSEILEIGSGDCINTILFALAGAKHITGIDLDLRLLAKNAKGEAIRKLADYILKQKNISESLEHFIQNRSINFLAMNATAMEFPDCQFDIIISRSVLEHIKPFAKLQREIARIMRPGGIIYHEIDPFYWIRGCHKRGLVDIPWAHARLELDDYYKFVHETEGPGKAEKRRKRLQTLNRLSLADWKSLLADDKFELLDWQESSSEYSETMIREFPEVVETSLDGLSPRDLIVGRIKVILQKNA